MENSLIQKAMPLLNTPYSLGECLKTIEAMPPGVIREIAFAEYYYFSGQPLKASAIAEKYLNDADLAIRFSACFICAYANLTLNRIPLVQKAMAAIEEAAASTDENTPYEYKALAGCISIGTSVLLHLPLPKILLSLKAYIHVLPPGLKLFVLYIEAHHCYLNGQYGACIGIAETALALESALYPIAEIYLHLVATMGYINLRHSREAKEHLLEAWKIAQPDGMIEALGEHHGLLGGMLEAVLKKNYPEDFSKIINITYSFSAGWRKIHNLHTGHTVADDLTTTEFSVAMLAAKGWSNKEIGTHLGVSVNTVKLHISSALQKLGIVNRKELSKFMLK